MLDPGDGPPPGVGRSDQAVYDVLGDPGLRGGIGQRLSSMVGSFNTRCSPCSTTNVLSGTITSELSDPVDPGFARSFVRDTGLMAPTRLIWRDEGRLLPRSTQDQLLRLLPEAGLTVYAGVGHTPRWEQPNRFAADLTRFSSRVLPPR